MPDGTREGWRATVFYTIVPGKLSNLGAAVRMLAQGGLGGGWVRGAGSS